MGIELILGSVVISTIISGAIGLYTSIRNNKLEYITKERSGWREEIRCCADELCGASYKMTRKICDRLKVRINAFGKRITNRYSDDSHIWEVISEIEKGNCNKRRLHQLQLALQEYLALLLKWDWERTKKEVQGEKLRCKKYILWLISILIYSIELIYEYYLKETQGASKNGVAYIGSWFIIAFVIACFIFVDKQMEELCLYRFVGHVVKQQKKKSYLCYTLEYIGWIMVVFIESILFVEAMIQGRIVLIGPISDSLSLFTIIISICFAVGALITNEVWMLEFIERYHKYAKAIDKIRSELFGLQWQQDNHL